LISASSRSMVSFGPWLLGIVVNPSAAMTCAPQRQAPATIKINLLVVNSRMIEHAAGV
jgi:hypothetical protein